MTRPRIHVKALAFDVFGTCVDWRGTIIEEGVLLNRRWQLNVDWAGLADAWRGLYQPAMQQVRSGQRPFTVLDVLHRESLDALADRFGLASVGEPERRELNRVWHRLRPWPDVVAGLNALKRHYIITPLSNGNIALLVDMAKHAGLPWDVILGAEVAGCYKPEPEAYLSAARLLDLPTEQCLMVAAHNDDLYAARDCGLRTAFVCRPTEYGPEQTTDLEAESDWDIVVGDFAGLAAALTPA